MPVLRHLLKAQTKLRHASCEAIDVGALERYARPIPAINEYDQLLTGWRGLMSNQMACSYRRPRSKPRCKSFTCIEADDRLHSLAAWLNRRSSRGRKATIGYLEALLLAEIEERERNTIERRIREALYLPRVKTLEEFDYTQSPNCDRGEDAARPGREGGCYIDRAEPVLFIGECGTGKTCIYSRDSAWQRVPSETPGAFHHRGRAGQRSWSRG